MDNEKEYWFVIRVKSADTRPNVGVMLAMSVLRYLRLHLGRVELWMARPDDLAMGKASGRFGVGNAVPWDPAKEVHTQVAAYVADHPEAGNA